MKVEYVRDGLIEEFHEGYLVELNSKDEPSIPYYLRSCAKPLQATLLIDYGIDLTSEELAFCSGSHAGEDCHIEIAKKIINKFDLNVNMLKCGVHVPLSRSMQNKMLIKGESPSQLHNNCSGKHLGFLAICVKKGWDVSSYDLPEHPLQKAIKRKIEELCEIKKNTYPLTTDGCGVPILSMPLKNMVLGYKNIMQYDRLVQAILNNPYIYGGENRTDTEIIQNSENILAKVGAGGLCVVFNTKLNDGFAVKINDCSMEARRVAVLEILKRKKWANIVYENKIKTIQGKEVGEIICKF